MTSLAHRVSALIGYKLNGDHEDRRQELAQASERLQREVAGLNEEVKRRIDESDDPFWELARQMRGSARRRQ